MSQSDWGTAPSVVPFIHVGYRVDVGQTRAFGMLCMCTNAIASGSAVLLAEQRPLLQTPGRFCSIQTVITDDRNLCSVFTHTKTLPRSQGGTRSATSLQVAECTVFLHSGDSGPAKVHIAAVI